MQLWTACCIVDKDLQRFLFKWPFKNYLLFLAYRPNDFAHQKAVLYGSRCKY